MRSPLGEVSNLQKNNVSKISSLLFGQIKIDEPRKRKKNPRYEDENRDPCSAEPRKKTPRMGKNCLATVPKSEHNASSVNEGTWESCMISPGNQESKKHSNNSNSKELSSFHTPDNNRKERSLILLCHRFFNEYPLHQTTMDPPIEIDLGALTQILQSERRRLYDIINILESLEIAKKVEKNKYLWYGDAYLNRTLARLKKLALQWKLDPITGDYRDPSLNNTQKHEDYVQSRKERSLGILCQKFIMLFLITPEPHLVSLDSALQFLLGNGKRTQDQIRTKSRRIYDICNVLSVLKLVEKQINDHKIFKYIGPQVQPSIEDEDVGPGSIIKMRQSLLSPRPELESPSIPMRKLKLESNNSFVSVSSFTSESSFTSPVASPSPFNTPTLLCSFSDVCEVAEMEWQKLRREDAANALARLQQSPSPWISQPLFQSKRVIKKGSPRVALKFHNKQSTCLQSLKDAAQLTSSPPASHGQLITAATSSNKSDDSVFLPPSAISSVMYTRTAQSSQTRLVQVAAPVKFNQSQGFMQPLLPLCNPAIGKTSNNLVAQRRPANSSVSNAAPRSQSNLQIASISKISSNGQIIYPKIINSFLTRPKMVVGEKRPLATTIRYSIVSPIHPSISPCGQSGSSGSCSMALNNSTLVKTSTPIPRTPIQIVVGSPSTQTKPNTVQTEIHDLFAGSFKKKQVT